jgi:hypothetical protein
MAGKWFLAARKKVNFPSLHAAGEMRVAANG